MLLNRLLSPSAAAESVFGTLCSAWDWWSRARTEEPALVLGNRTISHGELARQTQATASWLYSKGVGRSDRVVLLAQNSLEWCIVAMATIRCGAVVVPLNTRLTSTELAQMIEDADPKLCFVSQDQRSKLLEDGVRPAIVPIADVAVELTRHLDDVSGPDLPEVSTDDVVLIIYTSGTTGTPKGVMHTHGSLLASVIELFLKDQIPSQDLRVLWPLPLYVIGGLVNCILMTTVRGGAAVISETFEPDETLELLVAWQITALQGVPTMFERLAESEDFKRHNLSHIKFATVGGARVTSDLIAAWSAQGVTLRELYGLTEAGSYVSYQRDGDVRTHPGTAGDGSIFTEIRTVAEDGSPCSSGESGEILVRGPAVCSGYWKRPNESAEMFDAGWLRTGDLGILDDAGYLTYVDRLKHIIITGGFNVSPVEVENVARLAPGVEDIVVIPVTDDRFGEAPAAIVQTRDGFDREALLELCNERLAKYKVPRYIVEYPGPLPRLASGKISRRELMERYADIPSRYPKL